MNAAPNVAFDVAPFAIGAAVLTVLLWTIAADAADRRRMTIGTLPPLLPALAAAVASLAIFGGGHAGAIVAVAGAAVAAVVDARTGSIFDPLTAALLIASLVSAGIDGSVLDGAGGGAATAGALLLVHALSGGRGLGLGDVKLGAALGPALGVANGLSAIALAFVFGAGYGVWLLATKRATPGTALRFGPFIAAGSFVVLVVPAGWRP